MPKQANRAHFEPHDGLLEWHLEKDMTYSAPAYRFLAFGKVEKEWEEDHMEFHAFVHNATGFTCWEEHIEVRTRGGGVLCWGGWHRVKGLISGPTTISIDKRTK